MRLSANFSLIFRYVPAIDRSRPCSKQALGDDRPACVEVFRKYFGLAGAATSPGPAATAATAATAAAAAASHGAASAAAATATPGEFFADLGCCGVFLVEDIERRQADVGDFFLTEKARVTR
jgi:hypothetical protein